MKTLSLYQKEDEDVSSDFIVKQEGFIYVANTEDKNIKL